MGGCLTLLSELERGPRGILYRARDARSGRLVSVRVPPPSWPHEASMLAAARAGSLVHPHIAPVLETGWHDGAAYVLLGEELGPRVNPVALTLREAVGIARDVATAVDYAARQGLAHPGLVPDLLRFAPDGRVVVTGYELPIAVDGPGLYLAPEVRNGAAVDAAANVYSLGAILYVLVEGSRLDAMTEDLDKLIHDAMRADPRRRPSAAALAAELTRWLEPRTTDLPRRRAWKDALVSTGLLALLLLGLASGNAPEARFPEPEKPLAAEPAAEAEAPPPRPPKAVEPPVPEPPKPEVAKQTGSFATPRPPKDVEVPPPPPARVGTVKHVHREYGVFVALEPASTVEVGDELEVVRDGCVVTVLTVRHLSRPEKLYPHGAAVCDTAAPVVEAGQTVRQPAR